MKVALAALALALAACSISHRSQDYACTKQADCVQGRQCIEGFCVVPGGGGPIDAAPPGNDAKKPPPDAPPPQCPPGCSSCDVAHHTCKIDCTQTSCLDKITCPSGYACTIECNASGACRHTIDCMEGKSCDITCSTYGSCRDVQCGDGQCNVTCSGPSTCNNVSCNNSCACDVSCSGPGSCNQLQCTSDFCHTTIPQGCTSMSQPPDLCDSCQ
jgi:hypothetical protein